MRGLGFGGLVYFLMAKYVEPTSATIYEKGGENDRTKVQEVSLFLNS